MTTATTAETTGRFSVAYYKGSNDVLGWDGHLSDRLTGRNYRLSHEELFEEFHGQQTWVRCAFPTKEALTKAARRKAQSISRVS